MTYRVLVLSTFPYPRDWNTSLFVKDVIKHSPSDFRFTVLASVPLLPWERGYSRRFLDGYRERLLRELTSVDDIVYIPYRVIPRVFLPVSGLTLLRGVEKILRQRSEFRQFCCIHGHSLFPEGWIATVLGRRMNLPVVCTVHGSDLYHAVRRWYLRGYARRVIGEADGLIVVSRTLLREMNEFFPIAARRRLPPVVIPNGIDPDELRAAIKNGLSSGDEALLRSVRAKGRAVILWVGGLRPIKQPDLAVKGFRALLERRATATLVIVGDGVLRRRLSKQVSTDPHLQKAVVFLGKRTHRETLAWIHRADLLLLTSKHEGFSGVTLEAAMLGTPVVASRVGGPEDLISAERGVIYEPVSPEAIGDALDKALQRRWSRHAFPADLAGYDWALVAKRVGQVYKLVMEREKGA